MKRLINNEPEDGSSSNSSDARYRERITEQQQQHFEELRKLQESLKSKNTASDVTEDLSTSSLKGNENEIKKEIRVELSRKKGLLRIVADKFSLLVERSAWKKMTSALRSLFGGKSVDELLLEVKTGNKSIKSLLALLRNKEKLSLQLRIAALLREIRLSRSVDKGSLNRILQIQNSLISNLSSVVRESSGRSDVGKLLQYNNQALSQSKFLSTQVVRNVEVSHSIRQSKSQGASTDCPASLFSAYYTFNESPASYAWVADLRASTGINISTVVKYLLTEVKNRIVNYFTAESAITTRVGIQMCTNTASSTQRAADPIFNRHSHHHEHIIEQQSRRTVHGNGCSCCSPVLTTRQSLDFSYSRSVLRMGAPGELLSGTHCNPAIHAPQVHI